MSKLIFGDNLLLSRILRASNLSLHNFAILAAKWPVSRRLADVNCKVTTRAYCEAIAIELETRKKRACKSAAPLHVITHCEDSIIGRELLPAKDTDSLRRSEDIDSLRRRMYATDERFMQKPDAGFSAKKKTREGLDTNRADENRTIIG